MSDNILTKSIYYSLFLLSADVLFYPNFGFKKNIIDSFFFGFDYWLSNKIFNNIIENNITNNNYKFFMNSFNHFILYLSSYNVIFKNDIVNAPNNHYYKTWYVILIWIFTIKYIIDKNVLIINNFNKKIFNKTTLNLTELSNFIDNNFNQIIKFPVDLLYKNIGENNKKLIILDNATQQFINSLQKMNIDDISVNLANMYDFINGNNSNLLQIINNNDSFIDIDLIISHMYDVINFNFKTYYYRVLIPFCSRTLSLLKTIMKLLWRILIYPKKWIPNGITKEIIDMYDDFMYYWEWFWYAQDMADNNINLYDKFIKTIKWIDINLCYYLPIYYFFSTTLNMIETGVNIKKWNLYLNEFINETQLCFEKTYKAEKYYKFLSNISPVLPIVKIDIKELKNDNKKDKNNKFLDKNN